MVIRDLFESGGFEEDIQCLGPSEQRYGTSLNSYRFSGLTFFRMGVSFLMGVSPLLSVSSKLGLNFSRMSWVFAPIT